jgi:uncharacterized membrane protein
MSSAFLNKFLSSEDLNKISGGISEVEKLTSGELRVCIKNKRGIFQGKYTPRELALNEFFHSGMDKTIDKTGVLIFILFGEKKFEIVADEGINSKIPDNKWDSIEQMMTDEFKNENYLNGILQAINEIGGVLKDEFPPLSDNPDELSNDVIVK